MHNSRPPVVIFVVVIPVLVVSLVFSIIWCMTGLWAWGGRQRLAAFAAAEGVSFLTCMAPIALPQTAHNPPSSLRVPGNFLYGSHHGVQVFACDFRRGQGRGVIMNSMVAVHGDLHGTSGLDLRRWQPLSLNGWTFLIPNRDAATLSRRKIRAAWDLVTAAATGSGSLKS